MTDKEHAIKRLLASCDIVLCFTRTPEDWAFVRDRSEIYYLRRNAALLKELVEAEVQNES